MRARNQDHARADRYEAQHGTELEPDGDRTNGTREQRSAEGLRLIPASHRRRQAPAPALSAIRIRLGRWAAPKITPSAAAPAAASNAKRATETGGNRVTASSADRDASTSIRPAQTLSITLTVAA